MGTAQIEDTVQTKAWIEHSIVGLLTALTWITLYKRIKIDFSVKKDGTTDCKWDFKH